MIPTGPMLYNISLMAGDDIKNGEIVWRDGLDVYPYRTIHACYSYEFKRLTNPRTGRNRTSRNRYHREIYRKLNSDKEPFGISLYSVKKGTICSLIANQRLINGG